MDREGCAGLDLAGVADEVLRRQVAVPRDALRVAGEGELVGERAGVADRVEAVREHPGAPELQVSGEAYLASQLWAKWRMRAKFDDAGGIVPGEPVWSLAPTFQPPEYIRGAARANPFPELSLEDSGSEPFPDVPPAGSSFPLGSVLLAAAAVLLFAGTVVLLWIDRLRKKAEESPSGA